MVQRPADREPVPDEPDAGRLVVVERAVVRRDVARPGDEQLIRLALLEGDDGLCDLVDLGNELGAVTALLSSIATSRYSVSARSERAMNTVALS